jgi:hypothetical protein
MFVKKTPANGTAAVLQFRPCDRQLEELYARRSAIETLIQSLEEYHRNHAKRFEIRKQRTA